MVTLLEIWSDKKIKICWRFSSITQIQSRFSWVILFAFVTATYFSITCSVYLLPGIWDVLWQIWATSHLPKFPIENSNILDISAEEVAFLCLLSTTECSIIHLQDFVRLHTYIYADHTFKASAAQCSVCRMDIGIRPLTSTPYWWAFCAMRPYTPTYCPVKFYLCLKTV